VAERHWSAWAARRGLPAAEESWFEALAFRDPGEDRALPGAAILLGQTRLPVAVVTSATAAIARHRLGRAGLPEPVHLVAADDAEHGKPHAQPYLTGAERLGLPAASCIAVEDAPDGAQAALAAGATTVAVLVSHRRDQVDGVLHVVADLAELGIEAGGVRIPVGGPAGTAAAE
jgi:sugar-phosphatase